MNIDPTETAKFDSIADRWWDTDGEFKTLHDINPVRLEFVNTRSKLVGASLLDVGCGGGIFAESLCTSGAVVTAIDMADASLEVAKLHLFESGLDIDYRLTLVEDLAEQQPESFDIVTCMEMLEHVPDPESVISACAKLVKSGGDVFFSTINRGPKAFANAIVGAEHLLRIVPKGTHHYEKFIKPSELAGWARPSGLSLVDVRGFNYNPFTNVCNLSDDVSVNYIAHFRKA